MLWRTNQGSRTVAQDSVGKLEVPIDIPDGAAQGVDNGWYLIDLRLGFDFSDVELDGGSSESNLTVSVNGYAAAQIDFERQSDGVRWSTLELLTGPAQGITRAETFELRFSNYMQVRSVTPGFGTLELAVAGHGVLPTAFLLPGSRIIKESTPPPDIEVSAQTRLSVKPGSSTSIPIAVRSRGQPAADVAISARTTREDTQLIVPSDKLPSVGKEPQTLHLRVTAYAPDTVEIHVRGRTGGNEVMFIQVDTERSQFTVRTVRSVVIIGASLALVLMLAWCTKWIIR